MDILQTIKDWLSPSREQTGSVARNRLQSMLVVDRTNVSPELMNMIKDDIIAVYQKYFEINDDDMEVRFDNNQNTVVLTTSISVMRVKRNVGRNTVPEAGKRPAGGGQGARNKR